MVLKHTVVDSEWQETRCKATQWQYQYMTFKNTTNLNYTGMFIIAEQRRPQLHRGGSLKSHQSHSPYHPTLYKGKAVPLQASSGPEGSRKLRSPYFTTTAQDGGRLSALRTGHLYPQEILLVLVSVRG